MATIASIAMVAADCLAQAGLHPDEIDMFITVSCTGYMIPSLDAYLINDLGFRADIRRLPLAQRAPQLRTNGGMVLSFFCRSFLPHWAKMTY